jgi:hypothetical protein
MPAGREADDAEATRAGFAQTPDLGANLLERPRMPRVQRIAEHARTEPEAFEPGDYRLGLVRRVLGVTAAR